MIVAMIIAVCQQPALAEDSKAKVAGKKILSVVSWPLRMGLYLTSAGAGFVCVTSLWAADRIEDYLVLPNPDKAPPEPDPIIDREDA